MRKVLIGITSKNRASILPKAIRSAGEQHYTNKAIAVFDDASSDNTATLEKDFPWVQWTLSKEPRGLMYARNYFLGISDAEYFCSLDDDAWFLNDNAVGIAIDYLDKHPDVAAIAFEILSPDNHKRDNDAIRDVETNNYIGCGHVLRISATKQVGMYSATPGTYGGEEKDLCIRFIDAGYRIIKLFGVRVWHDKTNIARNEWRQHRSGVCNDFVFMWRRTPLLYLFPSVFMKIYVHFIFPIKYKKLSLYTAFFRGFFDFVKAVVTGKIKRQPVSKRAFKKYLSFNK